MQVGEVNVGLGVDIGQFEAGLTRAMRSFQAFAQDVNKLGNGMQGFTSSSDRAAGSVRDVGAAAREAAGGAREATREVGFLDKAFGYAAVTTAGFTASLVAIGRKSFYAAAEVSEMDAAMVAIGNSTGVGGAALEQATKAIRSQGIELAESQRMAIEFAQGQIDLSKAADLARVAQDFAVIGQMNSTQAAKTLTRAIMTGNSQLLKSVGINKYASEAYQDYADELGVTTAALSPAQRQQAILNMVLEEGANVAGTYEAAMTEPGKVLRSFARIINDIQVEIGMVLKEGFGPLILSSYEMVKSFSLMLREGGALHPFMVALGTAIKQFTTPLAVGLETVKSFIKGFDELEVQTSQVMEKFRTLGPSIATLGAVMSTVGGTEVLKLFTPLQKLAGILRVGGALSTGFVTLIATSRPIRQVFINVVKAAKPLLGALFELGKVAAEAMEALQLALEVAAEQLEGPLVKGVEAASVAIYALSKSISEAVLPLLELVTAFAETKIGAQILAAALTLLIARKLLLTKVGKQTVGLVKGIGLSFKAASEYADYYSKASLVASRATGEKAKQIGILGGLLRTNRTLLADFTKEAKKLAKGVLSSIGPMIAVTAAVWAVSKAYESGAKRSREFKQAVSEARDSLKLNTAQLLENKKAAFDLEDFHTVLQKSFFEDGEAAVKLTETMGKLGLSLDIRDALALSAGQADAFASHIAAISVNMAELADTTTQIDSQFKATAQEDIKKAVLAIEQGGANAVVAMDSLSESITYAGIAAIKTDEEVRKKAGFDWASGFKKQTEAAEASVPDLKRTAQAVDVISLSLVNLGMSAVAADSYAKNLSAFIGAFKTQIEATAEATKTQIGYLVATGAVNDAQYEAAMAASQATAGYNEMSDATKNYILLQNLFAEIEKKRRKNTEEATRSYVSGQRQMFELYGDLIERGKEAAVTLDDYEDVILGATKAQVAFNKALFGQRKAGEEFLTGVSEMGDGVDALQSSGFDLREQLKELGAASVNMGLDFAEASVNAYNMIEAFVDAAVAAGRDEAAVRGLINELGLLATFDPEVVVYLRMDASQLAAELDAATEALRQFVMLQSAAMAFDAIIGGTSTIDEMERRITRIKAALDSVTGANKRTIDFSGWGKAAKDSAGSSGADAAESAFDAFVDAIAALGTKAVSKEFAQALLGSPEEIKAAIEDLLETARATGVMNVPAVRQELQKVLDARGKLVTLSEERIRLANELATAEEKLATAQERQQAVREMAGEFDRALYEIPQEKLDTILASVVEAQNKLGETQSRLADLRNQQVQFVVDFARGLVGSFTAKGSITGQATKLLETARQFRDNIIMLASRGFPQDIISQVVGLGATEGNKLAKKLLAMSAGDLVQLRSIYGELQATAMQAAVITSDVLFGSDISQAQADLAQQEGVVRQLLRDAMTEADLQAAAAQARIDGLKTELQSNVDATKLLTRQLQTSFGSTLEHYLHVGLGVYNESLFSMVRAFREMLTGIGTGEYSFLDPENWRASQALLMGNVPGRAMGGTVMGGRPYMVGEVGPELFVPGRTGTIVPTSFAGGGSSTSNHYEINVNVAPGSNPGEVGRQIVEAIRQYERRNGSSWRG